MRRRLGFFLEVAGEYRVMPFATTIYETTLFQAPNNLQIFLANRCNNLAEKHTNVIAAFKTLQIICIDCLAKTMQKECAIIIKRLLKAYEIGKP
jgi:hypothetical protein